MNPPLYIHHLIAANQVLELYGVSSQEAETTIIKATSLKSRGIFFPARMIQCCKVGPKNQLEVRLYSYITPLFWGVKKNRRRPFIYRGCTVAPFKN